MQDYMMQFFRREPTERAKLEAQIGLIQADSELIGGLGYHDLVPIIMSYDFDEMLVVSETAREEFGHGMLCYKILDNLGFDTRAWIEHHSKYYRWRIAEFDRLAYYKGRPTKDARVNIFYYPLALPNDSTRTAIRFAIFQFLQDRGAGVQLKDALTSSFTAWAEANKAIMEEEQDHLEHGEKKLAELRGEYHELVDAEIKLWLPRVVATFGKPHSEFDDKLRYYGITSRTHEEKLRDFLNGDEGIHTANERSNIGLSLPSAEEIIAMWRAGDYLKEI